jgi:hypothetical protein
MAAVLKMKPHGNYSTTLFMAFLASKVKKWFFDR